MRRVYTVKRPSLVTCIRQSDHFGINPKEFLQLAGWTTLCAFELHITSAEKLPPEAIEVAMEIAHIPNPGARKAFAEAILTLIRK
jgi:hypothetical protein